MYYIYPNNHMKRCSIPYILKVKVLCHVWLFATPWTVASRQEYWSELSFPSPGDCPNPGIEPRPPALQADSLPYRPPGKPIIYLRELQIKRTMRFHYTPLEWVKIQNTDNTKCWLEHGAIRILIHCWWECKKL